MFRIGSDTHIQALILYEHDAALHYVLIQHGMIVRLE